MYTSTPFDAIELPRKIVLGSATKERERKKKEEEKRRRRRRNEGTEEKKKKKRKKKKKNSTSRGDLLVDDTKKELLSPARVLKDFDQGSGGILSAGAPLAKQGGEKVPLLRNYANKVGVRFGGQNLVLLQKRRRRSRRSRRRDSS